MVYISFIVKYTVAKSSQIHYVCSFFFFFSKTIFQLLVFTLLLNYKATVQTNSVGKMLFFKFQSLNAATG